ncbi:hypothetical protein [Mixta calida]|uniref:hypothetical protein n=2 Tax=Mixta calida TaxID=665913 RepID=UPI0028ABD9BA|nr:hypothetical protein [Mixta calida]MBS6059499.1 hypothetical protein [Pantoea sp.]
MILKLMVRIWWQTLKNNSGQRLALVGLFLFSATLGALNHRAFQGEAVGINLYLGLTCLFRSIVTSAVVRTMDSTGFRIWMQGKRLAAAPLWLNLF